ncbi:MAG: DUF2948 family protein [Alphaproteobacteria bacterium]|nr:MAG: DUF2948 family protein [Alphaproteobacteria bacterium]
MSDARFEDAGERALRLKALTEEDLTVISALVQDAVARVGDFAWAARHHRLAVLINRFRWEDREDALRQGRDFERVRALLVIDGVLKVRASGLDPKEQDLIVSILALEFDPGEDGGGTIRIILAGDGEMAVDVECIDVSLADVTRPYVAPSHRAPEHGD